MGKGDSAVHPYPALPESPGWLFQKSESIVSLDEQKPGDQ